MKIKTGDNVVVISGKDRGKTGKVTRAFPRLGAVLVEGINVVKRHERSRQAGKKGQVVEKAMPINASNVLLVDKGGRGSRVGYRVEAGKKLRVFKKSGSVV